MNAKEMRKKLEKILADEYGIKNEEDLEKAMDKCKDITVLFRTPIETLEHR